MIRAIKKEGNSDISTMSVREIYQFTLEREREVLKDQVTVYPMITMRPLKFEYIIPLIDWELTLRLACLKGLLSDLSSHLFNQLHNILPSQKHLHRMNIKTVGEVPGNCGFCVSCNDGVIHTISQ